MNHFTFIRILTGFTWATIAILSFFLTCLLAFLSAPKHQGTTKFLAYYQIRFLGLFGMKHEYIYNWFLLNLHNTTCNYCLPVGKFATGRLLTCDNIWIWYAFAYNLIIDFQPRVSVIIRSCLVRKIYYVRSCSSFCLPVFIAFFFHTICINSGKWN